MNIILYFEKKKIKVTKTVNTNPVKRFLWKKPQTNNKTSSNIILTNSHMNIIIIIYFYVFLK